MSWTISSLIAFWAFFGTVRQTSNVMSICDVLADPKGYDEQVVTLRAMLVSRLNDSDFDELGPLETDSCYTLRRRDSLRIGIAAASRLPTPPDNWKPDWASYDRAQEVMATLLQKNPNLKGFLVTVRGIIYDGGPQPSAVAAHPWHPAEMRIAVWADVRKP